MSDYLSQDIFNEIFKRLAPKTLICCTLVCKSWHDRITSDSFISAHLNHALIEKQTDKPQTLIIRHCAFPLTNVREQCILLHDDENGDAVELNLPQNSNGEFATVGFCNGLFCLAATESSTNIQTIILWNPSISKFMTLPPHMLRRSMERNSALVGFGADFANGEYHHKVVRILFPLRKRLSQTTYIPVVEVFSVRNRSWRRIKQDDIRCREIGFLGSPALVNGVVHWVVMSKPDMDCHPQNLDDHGDVWPLILAFDFHDDLLREMTLPNDFAKHFEGNGYVIQLWDCLAAIKYEQSTPNVFNLWVMKEYGIKDSWTKLFNFDLINDVVSAVGFRKNGDLFMSSRDYKLVLYDPKSKLIRKKFEISSWPISFYIGDYLESLVLLEGCKGIFYNDKENGNSGECSKRSSRKKISK